MGPGFAVHAGPHARPRGTLAAMTPRHECAIALSPAERRDIVEAFFAAHPGDAAGTFGLGRAILDFQAWETDSGRIAEAGGSDWWRAVNGMMVLDIAEAAQDAGGTRGAAPWRAYAKNPCQSRLWEAHQRSLHAAIALSHDLLANESEAERAFAAIVIEVVDRTALALRPTDTDDLANLTQRYYPAEYPIEPGQLAGLEVLRERTAARLVDTAGRPFEDVGMDSRRWD